MSERTYGLLIEFEDANQLVHACEQVRDAGFRHWDAFTPFPIHGMDRAMGIRGTRLPWIVLAGGLGPENIEQAILEVQPYAVDVSGGVEKAKGIKDADKIAAFMRGVESANRKRDC